MSNDNFDYKDLQQRGDLAVEMFRTVLNDLDLILSIREKDGVRELIFSDRTAYMQKNEKRAVSTEVKMINAMLFDNVEDIPKHILDKQKEIYYVDKQK